MGNARGLSHFARVRLDLDFLVAHGVLETRVRPDGQVGYWPTTLAFTLAEAEEALLAHLGRGPARGGPLPRLCAAHRCRHHALPGGDA
jgi:hypothetical protein